jgi:hypothetical protein
MRPRLRRVNAAFGPAWAKRMVCLFCTIDKNNDPFGIQSFKLKKSNLGRGCEAAKRPSSRVLHLDFFPE